jgi:ketosteroid isomerase-like protein
VITTEDVVRTHTEFNRALTARDFDALSKLYADDYMLVRPDGSVEGGMLRLVHFQSVSLP